jgi:hypothetical protein
MIRNLKFSDGNWKLIAEALEYAGTPRKPASRGTRRHLDA